MVCYARCWMTASECIFDLRSLQTALKLIGMLAAAHSVKMGKQVHLLFFNWWLEQWHVIQTQNLENDLDSSVNKATPVSPIRKEMFAKNFEAQMLLTYDTDSRFCSCFWVISSFAIWADEGWWHLDNFSVSKDSAVCRSVSEILGSCCVL